MHAQAPSAVVAFAICLIGCGLGRGTPASQQPRPQADPALSPGDVLRVSVWRHPEFSGEFTVGPDSTLLHPLYQGVKVGGVPLATAKQRMRGFLVAYEQDVQLTLEPLFPTTVAGEVRQPNLYRLPQGTTIAQAVAVAGGPTERGRLDRVRVIRRQSQIMLDLTSDHPGWEQAPVASGDQILVGRRSGFNAWRDLVMPLASVTAAVAAIINVSRR